MSQTGGRRHRRVGGGARPVRLGTDPGAVLLGGLLLGACAVVVFWWRSGGSPAGTDDLVASGARLTGMLAGYAGVVLLALMARIPLLERTVGTARLVRGHAVGGRATIILAVTHAALATAHWTAGTDGPLPHRIVAPAARDPRLLEALIALALLLAVAAASARTARRRLGHSVWHGVHLTTYAAMALGLAHQLNGPDMVARPVSRAAWWALYATATVLLIRYRLVVPLRQALRHRLRVAAVHDESPGVVSILITGRDLRELGAAPGQFFRWRFLDQGLWRTARPYSLSAAPQDSMLRITVKCAGAHSRALAGVRPGTRVLAQGPYGSLTADPLPARKVLLLGGGSGIAPLRALLETLPGEITLIYRARRAEDLALRTELDAIAAIRGARVIYAVDGPGPVSLPLTGRALRAVIPHLAAHTVYLTGPPGMTAAARRALRRAGVPRRNVRCESFDF